MRLLTIMLLLVVRAAPSPGEDRSASRVDMTAIPDLSGQWQNATWGTVMLTRTSGDAFEGTYSNTGRNTLGRVSLTYSPEKGAFVGTWADDRFRFGRVTIRVGGDRMKATGAYWGDAKCESRPGQPVGQEFQWQRAAR